MKHNKLFRMLTCGFLAASMCGSMVSQAFAAERGPVSDVDDNGSQSFGTPEQSDSNTIQPDPSEQTGESGSKMEMGISDSEAIQPDSTEQTEELDSETETSQLESEDIHSHLKERSLAIVNRNSEFEIPEAAAAEGEFHNLKWYVDLKGVMHIEDGVLDLSQRGRFSPFSSAAKEAVSIKVENIHGTDKVTIVGDARGLFQDFLFLTNFDGLKFDTAACTSMQSMFQGCCNLKTADLHTWKTSSVSSMQQMFNGCEELEELNLQGLDHTHVGSMYRMFKDCIKLKDLNVSDWTSSRREDLCWISLNMAYMFENCESLTSLDVSSWNTINAESMEGMFNGCKALASLDTGSWNTSRVESMRLMFNGCTSLQSLNVNGWDTSHVTSMEKMFSGCRSLASLDLNSWNTFFVGTMEGMFNECQSLELLDLSSWNNYKLKNMCSMFSGCTELKNVNFESFSTPNVENMSDLFHNCSSLESLDLSSFSSKKPYSMKRMFYGCQSLKSLNIPTLTAEYESDLSGMFENCSSLTNLDLSHMTACVARTMDGMFRNCSSLTGLDLSNMKSRNLESMNEMFSGCLNLERVNLSGWDTSKVSEHSNMFANTDCLESMIFNKSYLNSESFDEEFLPEGSISFEDENTYQGYMLRDQFKENFLNNNKLTDDEAVTVFFTKDTSLLPKIILDPNGGLNPAGKKKQIQYTIRPSRKTFGDNTLCTNGDKLFLGWNTKKDGSGIYYNDPTEIPDSLFGGTLYAQWGTVKLYATSLRLGATLGVNYFFDVDEAVAADPTAQIMIRFKRDRAATAIPLSKAVKNTTSVKGKTLYKVVQFLQATEYGEGMEVWVKTDTFESVHSTFSVSQYANKVLTNAKYSEVMKKLVSAAVLYGSAAQKYYGYKTDSLASSNLPLNQEAADLSKNVSFGQIFNNYSGYLADRSAAANPYGEQLSIGSKIVYKVYIDDFYGEMKDLKVTWKGKQLKIQKDSDNQRNFVALEDLEGLDVNRPIAVQIENTVTGSVSERTYALHSDLLHELYYGESSTRTELLKSFYAYTHYITEYLGG